MTEVTNEVINRLLCEIEVLYFDHFDEISDKTRNVNLSLETMVDIVSKVEKAVEQE